MEVKIINKSKNHNPDTSSIRSVGADLRAELEQPIILEYMKPTTIPTGLFLQLPKDCEAQVISLKSVVDKYGIVVKDAPVTVGEDEICVEVVNQHKDPHILYPGDRFAQVRLISPISEKIYWENANVFGIDETN